MPAVLGTASAKFVAREQVSAGKPVNLVPSTKMTGTGRDYPPKNDTSAAGTSCGFSSAMKCPLWMTPPHTSVAQRFQTAWFSPVSCVFGDPLSAPGGRLLGAGLTMVCSRRGLVRRMRDVLGKDRLQQLEWS